MYSLRFFGGFSLLAPSEEPDKRLSQRRVEALLALLVVSGELGCTRDRAIGMLWPESDETHARHSLRNALHTLRTDLDVQAVLSVGDTLRIDPAVVASDVAHFTRAVAAKQCADAVRVYHGPLLDGFHIDDAPDFERWLEGERARFARAYADCVEQLAVTAEAEANWLASSGWWQRAVDHDPCNTRLVIRLMRALSVAGDRANALLAAEAHRQRLLSELEIAPDGEFDVEVHRLRVAHAAATATRTADASSRDDAPDGAGPHAATQEASKPAAALGADGAARGDAGGGRAQGAAVGERTARDDVLVGGLQPPHALEPRRRTRAVVLTVAAVALIAAATGTWRWYHRELPPLDPDVVAIVPFSTGGHASLAAEAVELHDVIERALIDGPAPRALEPARMRYVWDRMRALDVWGDPAAVDDQLARRTAASLVLRGTVDSTSEGRLLVLTLTRMPSRTIAARREVPLGDAREAPQQAQRALLEVLALEAGQPSHRLPELVRHPAPAVRTYLAGVRRAGAVKQCRDLVTSTWALDSTLVYSGLACLSAAGFVPVEPWRDSVARAVWARRGMLVKEDAAFVDALLGPWFGRADNAERRIALWVIAAQAAPQWWVPSMALARELFSFGPRTTLVDWRQRGIGAMRRAAELSAWSQYGPVEMVFWTGIFEGDSSMSRQALQARENLGRDAPVYPFTYSGYWGSRTSDWPWLFDAAFRGGAQAMAFNPDTMKNGRSQEIIRMLSVLAQARPGTTAIADAFFARWEQTREAQTPSGLHLWPSWRYRTRGNLAQFLEHRRLDYLNTTVRENALYDDLAGDVLGHLRGVLDLGVPPDTLVRAAVARLERVANGDSVPATKPGERGVAACWASQWRLAHGDTAGVVRAIAWLRELDARDRAGQLDGLPGSGRWSLCPAILEAKRARLLGHGALAAARALDQMMRPYPVPRRSFWSLWGISTHDQILPYSENLDVARLLADAGDTAAALSAVRRRPRYAALQLQFFITPTEHLRLEGRLAAAMADTLGAMRAYDGYLALRPTPPAHPPWRAEWDSVRAELAALRSRQSAVPAGMP